MKVTLRALVVVSLTALLFACGGGSDEVRSTDGITAITQPRAHILSAGSNDIMQKPTDWNYVDEVYDSGRTGYEPNCGSACNGQVADGLPKRCRFGDYCDGNDATPFHAGDDVRASAVGKVVVDLGSRSNFSPVKNFLLPLARSGKFSSSSYDQHKYHIDQLFLSHLDNDHVSDYAEFRKYFHPGFMTCPNKNPNQNDHFKVNEDLIGEIKDSKQLVLNDMDTRGTNSPEHPYLSEDNPLISIVNEIELHFIKPGECEAVPELKEKYANNISLVVFIQLGSKTIFIPGDLSKEGMEYLISTNPSLRKELEDLGVDYLIAPHHGLATSFSEYFFQTINGGKTRLNIISEKERFEDSEENRSGVDTRYYGEDYSSGLNTLGQRGVKTSMGHIVIDLTSDDPVISQYQYIDDVIREFTT